MDTPRSRYTVVSAVLALTIGFLLLPALNIVRVNARGLGDEHTQPWRSKATVLAEAAQLAALSFATRWRKRLARATDHPLFKPALGLAAVALLALVNHKALFAAPLVLGTTLTEGRHIAEFLAWEGSPLKRDSVTVLSGQTLKSGAVVGRVRFGIGRVSIPAVVGTGTGTVGKVFAGPDVEVGNYVLTCSAAVANGGVFSLVAPDGKTLPSLTMTPGAGGTTNYRSRHINFTITDATDFIVGDVFTFVVSTTAPTVIGGTGTDTISALALGPDARPGNYRVICTAAVTNGGVWQVYRGGPDGGDSIGIFTQTAGSGTATAFETRHVSFTLTDATDVIVGNYFDVCVFNNLAGGKVVAWDPTTYDGRHAEPALLYAAVDASGGDAVGVIVSRDAVVLKSALEWGAAITDSQKESAYLDLAARGIIARDSVAA